MTRKILLTWYGITDLRASFGFEPSGPILGALTSEQYDEVVILGYSDDLKQAGINTFDDSVLVEALSAVPHGDAVAAQAVVSRFSNTRQAHKFYCEWLMARLRDKGVGTTVAFRPVHLKELNDTEGIYEAATSAMDSISAEAGKVVVSLFLSPGTPVMAFVWAFAALNFPRVKKRLISSSRPGKPPETISLPTEWLEWNGRRKIEAMPERKSFDLIFHLFGEQRLPSYWGVSQYAARFHVFVTSDEFSPEAIAPFLNGAKPFVLRVDAFNPEDVRLKMLEALEQMKAPASARIGFNLTGGTKLMYAGAMAACRKVNGTPFYFSQQNNCVIDLVTFEKTPIKAITSVETFLRLNATDVKVSNKGEWDHIPDIHVKGRKELTEFLWKNKSDVADIYRSISEMTDDKSVSGRDAKKKAREGCCPFTYPLPGKGSGAHQISTASEWDGTAEFSMGAVSYQFDHFPYFAKYITGGWFEEYVYSKLKPLEDEGLIFDLRIGLTLSFNAHIPAHETKNGYRVRSHNEERSLQEFDVLFTDGSRLYIVECKAGGVTSDYVIKLNDEVRQYGGIGGRGILACCFPPKDPTVMKRIEESRSCRLVCGDGIADQIRKKIEEDRGSYI